MEDLSSGLGVTKQDLSQGKGACRGDAQHGTTLVHSPT